jgi:hypothetical protein
MSNPNSLPVLLIAFNRPVLTRSALLMIAKFKPPIFFFSVDGPRENSTDDLINVELCRDLIKNFNWNCEIHTNFSTKNYGSGVWPYKSINWAFGHVEKLLIIEDDVFTSEDFYRESNKILDHYKDQREIFGICASNISDLGAVEQSNDLFFSKYFSGWGWATWKDRWEEYRFDIANEPKIGFLKLLYANNGNVFISLYFLINFYLVRRNKIQAWDYQINHLLFSSDSFVIKFKKNLSSNIGVGKNATHTKYLPKIQVNKIDGSYDPSIQIVLVPSEERRWRKSRIRFILKSWLLRMSNFEKNTAR